MTKSLTRLTLAALAASLCALSTAAQAPTPAQSPAAPASDWVEVSPPGEDFTARMPKPPESRAEQFQTDALKVSGRRYEASGDDGTAFIVWSLKAGRDKAPHLDDVAELAWDLLVKPEVELLKNANREEWKAAYMGMTYRPDFELERRGARAYSVNLERRRGAVYVFADRPRLYIVAALAANAQSPQWKQFIDSVVFKKGGAPSLAAPSDSGVSGGGVGTGEGTGVGPGRGGNTGGGVSPSGGSGGRVDYTGPFRIAEVTKKATITFKPEPGFTESARKFGVTGVVRLLAILSTEGEVTRIRVVKSLPHGLTEKAIAAGRAIRFTPAQKDGQTVSQYVVLEYNFNIY